MKDDKAFVRWVIDKFTTREHFMRTITTLILAVAVYETITVGDISDHWLILVGTVIGYYFKTDNKLEE
jgi:hypothetical protein